MAESPCPGQAARPDLGPGAVGREPGRPKPTPEGLGSKPHPLFSSDSWLPALRPAQSGPGLRHRFSAPLFDPSQPFPGPNTPALPMRRAGEKTRMGAVLQAAKTGRQDQGRGRRVSSLQARAGVSVPRPGTPGPQAGARAGSPQSIEGRGQARPAPRPYPGDLGFPPCPVPIQAKERTGDPGPKAGQAPETGLARSFAPFPDGNPWRPSPQNGNRP